MPKYRIKSIEEFGEIVNERQVSVRACVRVLGIPSGYVDDIVQETFIVGYKKFKEFVQSRSMRSWLLGIARNLVLHERRKTARRLKLIHENLTDLLSDEAISVISDFEAEEKLNAVKSCI